MHKMKNCSTNNDDEIYFRSDRIVATMFVIVTNYSKYFVDQNMNIPEHNEIYWRL